MKKSLPDIRTGLLTKTNLSLVLYEIFTSQENG